MRNLCTSLLALGLVLALIQAPGPSEALKIKKVVKDAAKLSKKYGYLLASRNKKLYAIPFPMPLPVFVKRQHIYTQVPIIPRYVQHPQAYGAPAYAAGESSSSYEPMASMQTSATASTLASYYGDSSGGSSQRQRSKKSLGGQKETSSAPDLSPTSPTAIATKYLTQLASLLGQSVPMFGGSGGGSNRDLLTKLLNGQAKVLPPTSLISAIKGPSAALLKYQQQQADSAQQDTSTDQDSSKQQNESSSGSGSGSSNADAQSSLGYTSQGATDSTKPPGESQSASQSPEATRPSASELHRSRYRVPYGMAMRSPYGPMMMDPRRIPMSAAMMGSPLMSPLAAMASMQAPAGLMPRLPMSQLAAANQYLAMLEPHADQLESLPSEPSELTAALSHHHHQRQQGQQQTPDEPNVLAGGNGSAADQQQSQLLERRRQLLKLALIKERQEAERLLESRLVLARAKQINQQLNQLNPVGQQQATMQLMSLYRQQQAAQQLQQMRYLQLLQQQQLQQNSIDNQ